MNHPARRHALELWEQSSECCFDREETLCLSHGIVIALPDLYLMAMPVHSFMTDEEIYRNAHLRETRLLRHLSPPDLLHIVHCVGSLPAFARIARESAACQHLTHLCYHRRRHLVRVPIQKILRS